MAMAEPSNEDNEYAQHHANEKRGGFQRIENYDACEEDGDDEEATAIEEEGNIALSFNELMYSAHSFHVISLPVSVTMILAALAVTYVNTPETILQGEALMSQAYHVWKVGEDDSTSKKLALDFANGLVIVTVIGTLTFGIVLLYKYRCMKVLIGYMMFSSMTLLGVLGAELFGVAIEKYRVPIDWFTFVFGIYNFAVVGVTAIFYATGIPTFVTQGYLICSSVIISWQLSHFDVISTWTLLIMLGLYDLLAVLTPCGPLRALVNLMSDEDSPDMPGLLYEAEIPEGLKRPVMSGRHTGGRDCSEDEGSDSPPSSMSAERYQQPSVGQPTIDSHIDPDSTLSNVSGCNSASGDVEMSGAMGNDRDTTADTAVSQERSFSPKQFSNPSRMSLVNSASSDGTTPERTAMVPFAIAKLYRLPLTSAPSFLSGSGGRRGPTAQCRRSGLTGNISTSPLLKSESAAEEDGESSNLGEEGTPTVPFVIPDGEYTSTQLKAIVEAILPSNGAKILKQPRRALQGEKEDRFKIVGSDGSLKRIVFVDCKNGKVYEEMQDDDDDSNYEGRFSNTIKLGLGDFIFYSVLVAKSAQYSFPCFVSSFLVVLAGLGGTLVLLAVYKHALPALPISIFLAVGFYVFVRFIVEPWIHLVMRTPFYV